MQVVCRVVVAWMIVGTFAVPTPMTAQASPAPSQSASVEGKRALAAEAVLSGEDNLRGVPAGASQQPRRPDRTRRRGAWPARSVERRRVWLYRARRRRAAGDVERTQEPGSRRSRAGPVGGVRSRARAAARGSRAQRTGHHRPRERRDRRVYGARTALDCARVLRARWALVDLRYNFEHFSPDGKAEEYISLESAEAAQRALTTGDVRIGGGPGAVVIKDFALNWYTGKAHGTVARYASSEPSYERVRADVLRWLRTQALWDIRHGNWR